MSRLFKLFALSSIAVGLAMAQPTITAISNSASFAKAPLDANMNPIGNNNVSLGSIFVIEGKGMGPAALVQAASLPLGTTLPAGNGTSVSISSGGQTVSAFMVYTFDAVVAAILPSNTPVGAATVKVTYNGQTSAPYSFNVVPTQFGVYTLNSQGTGPAVAQIFASATSVNLMGLSAPAQAGQTLVLYGTGLGAIPGQDNVPPGIVSVGTNVSVNIAGIRTPAAYAGRSPNFPGLDQINFVLPANVPTGCYIPAEVTASGRPSNLFYLDIGVGNSACVHPYGLSGSTLSTLDAGGKANTGLFLMLRATVLGVAAEGLGGLFETVDANAAFQLYNRIQFSFGGYSFPVPSGSCAVLDTIDPPVGFNIPDFTTLQGKELKAADFLNLAGTNGNSAVIPRMTPDTGGYLTAFFTTLGKGTWTLTGPTGPDVGAFSGSTTLPENLIWTNGGNFANPPRTDLTITWTGGAQGQSLVTILGASVVLNTSDPTKSRGAIFYCNAPAGDGKFLVPAAITQQLPSSNGLAANEVYFGQLGIYAGGGSTFTAPLISGAKFDGAYLAYGEAQTQSVKFQ